MIADYTASPLLFESCINLISECFPESGIKATAKNAITYQASWPEISTPFIHYINSQLVAHLGVLKYHLMIDGKPLNVAGIHGVCVKPTFRRQGIFKMLMREALDYINHHYDGSLLFTDEPHYYEPFGFRVVEENDFLIEDFQIIHISTDLRALNLESPADLALMHRLLNKRSAVSMLLGICDEHVLFTYAALNTPVLYSEKHRLLISYTVDNQTLYLKDLVFTSPLRLETALSLIPESFNKVIIQFCPDFFSSIITTPIAPSIECKLMVSKQLKFESANIRFPELARC